MDTRKDPLTIGVIGLGYVGLPLVVAFAEAGDSVIALDTDIRKIAASMPGLAHDRRYFAYEDLCAGSDGDQKPVACGQFPTA